MPTNYCETVKTAENYIGKENVINASLIEQLRCFWLIHRKKLVYQKHEVKVLG